MSRRVAIRKMPALAPLAMAAGKFVGRGALMGAGMKVLGGNKEEGQQEANQSFTDKVQSRGKALAGAGASYAQAQQASQQRMEERGHQMAEKAKQGSQITTGEPMDMSWQLLKDVYFDEVFQTPEYAQSRQRIIDSAIENMQNTNLFQPNQHAKIRAGFVDDAAKFRQNVNPDPQQDKYLDNTDKLTQPRFPADYMYDQEHSDPKSFPGMYNIPAHHLLNAIGRHIDYKDFGDVRDHAGRVMAKVPNLITRRKDGSHSKRLPGYTPLLQEMNRVPLVSTLGEKMTGVSNSTTLRPQDVMRPNLGRNDSLLAANRERNAERRADKLRRLAEQTARLEAQRARQQKEEDENQKADYNAKIADYNAKKRAETNKKAQETRQRNKDAKASFEENKQSVASAEEQIENEKFLDTEKGKAIAGKFSQFAGMANMHAYNGQLISPQRIRELPVMEQAVYNQLVKRGILKSSPMNFAWRMLKGELQLPHQITDALRDDLTTLDRAHKMTDTNDGTLIEGIHPDMEHVVKLLAEKHMGDMTPTKQRPVMPLFHGPHH